MNLRSWQYLLAVAEEQSITKAAKRLFISQPSLSQHIQKLEGELGTELIDRSCIPLRLTYAGELYIQAGHDIFDRERQMQQQIADVVHATRGRLTVGISTHRSTYIIPPILAEFDKHHKEIEIILEEHINAELEDLVQKGDLDLAISVLYQHREGFHFIPVLRENLLLFAPHSLDAFPNGRPDRLAPIANLADYRDAPFILLSSRQMLYQHTLSLCQEAGFSPRVRYETSSLNAAHAMVCSGLGVAILPDTLLRFGNFGSHPLHYRLSSFIAYREVGVIYKKGRYLSKAAQLFIQEFQRLFGNNAEQLPD